MSKTKIGQTVCYLQNDMAEKAPKRTWIAKEGPVSTTPQFQGYRQLLRYEKFCNYLLKIY